MADRLERPETDTTPRGFRLGKLGGGEGAIKTLFSTYVGSQTRPSAHTLKTVSNPMAHSATNRDTGTGYGGDSPPHPVESEGTRRPYFHQREHMTAPPHRVPVVSVFSMCYVCLKRCSALFSFRPHPLRRAPTVSPNGTRLLHMQAFRSSATTYYLPTTRLGQTQVTLLRRRVYSVLERPLRLRVCH
jgi:hypothetical protein